jgi:hypothetical protein
MHYNGWTAPAAATSAAGRTEAAGRSRRFRGVLEGGGSVSG